MNNIIIELICSLFTAYCFYYNSILTYAIYEVILLSPISFYILNKRLNISLGRFIFPSFGNVSVSFCSWFILIFIWCTIKLFGMSEFDQHLDFSFAGFLLSRLLFTTAIRVLELTIYSWNISSKKIRFMSKHDIKLDKFLGLFSRCDCTKCDLVHLLEYHIDKFDPKENKLVIYGMTVGIREMSLKNALKTCITSFSTASYSSKVFCDEHYRFKTSASREFLSNIIKDPNGAIIVALVDTGNEKITEKTFFEAKEVNKLREQGFNSIFFSKNSDFIVFEPDILEWVICI